MSTNFAWRLTLTRHGQLPQRLHDSIEVRAAMCDCRLSLSGKKPVIPK